MGQNLLKQALFSHIKLIQSACVSCGNKIVLNPFKLIVVFQFHTANGRSSIHTVWSEGGGYDYGSFSNLLLQTDCLERLKSDSGIIENNPPLAQTEVVPFDDHLGYYTVATTG